MRRKRIDWEEELKKTEKIRMKGFKYTLSSFILALFWVLGARQIQREFSFAPLLLTVFFVAAGTVLFGIVARRKRK